MVAAAASGQLAARWPRRLWSAFRERLRKAAQRQRALGSPAAQKMGGPHAVARERDWVLGGIAQNTTLRQELADRAWLSVTHDALLLQHQSDV